MLNYSLPETMNSRGIAVLFILLISGEQICRAVEAEALKPEAAGAHSMPDNQAKYTIPQLTKLVDGVLTNIKGKISNCFPLSYLTLLKGLGRSEQTLQNGLAMSEQTLQNGPALSEGSSTGWKFNRVDPVSYSCSHDTIRLHVEISFSDILIAYMLHLAQVLEGYLPQVPLSGLMSIVLNAFTSVLNLEIKVLVVLEQLLIPGARCHLVRFQALKITKIRLLNFDVPLFTDYIRGFLAPLLNLILQSAATEQIIETFAEEFSKLSVPLDLVQNCSEKKMNNKEH